MSDEIPFTEIELVGECCELSRCSLCGSHVEPYKDKNITINIGDAELSVISPIPVRALLCWSCVDRNKEALKHLLRMNRVFLMSLKHTTLSGFLAEAAPGKVFTDAPPCWDEKCEEENPSHDCAQCESPRRKVPGIEPTDLQPGMILPTIPHKSGLFGSFQSTPQQEPLGRIRNINVEEARQLQALFMEEDGEDAGTAMETVNNYYFAVIEDFVAECPGYAGKVIVGVFAEPELVSIFTVNKETGKLQRTMLGGGA